MILRRTLHLLLVLVSAIFIQACGSAADSGDKVKEGNTPGQGGDGGNPDNGRAVEVMVKGTPGLAGKDAVLNSENNNLLAGLAAQSTLKVKEIRVVRLGSSGEERTDLAVPSYSVKYDHHTGIHTINFASQYNSSIDLAIEAVLPNDERLRRPLPLTARAESSNTSIPHSVHVGTEYAMRAFFAHVSQYESQRFNELTTCTLAQECRTDAAIALTNLLALSGGASDFEITIPQQYDLREALAYLDDQVDLRRFVEKASTSVLAKTIAGQTVEGLIPDVLDSVVGNYNAVSFALELNQGMVPEKHAATVRHWTSVFSEIKTDGKITYQAPSMSVANMGFGIVSSLLVGAAPSVHHTVALTAGSAPEVTSSPEGELNLIEQVNAYAGYTLRGTYDYGLLQHQSVTGDKQATQDTIGWLNNPYFTSLYDASAQGALLSARVSTGLAYRLSGVQPPYKREELLEKLNRFSFSAFSKRAEVSPTDSSKGFDPAQLQGKRYGVVMLTQKFHETGDPLTAEGSIRHWEMETNGFELDDTQPAPATASDLDIFKTWAPQYDGTGLTASSATPVKREYEALLSRLTHDNQHYGASTGLLKLTTGPEFWEGISDPRGGLISFAINTKSDGQGIAHAIPLLTDTSLSAPGNGDTFQLMGNGIGFTATENYLYHVDESSLEFSSDSQTNNLVKLTLKKVKARQDRTQFEVSNLEESEPVTLTTTAIYGTGEIKNSVQMEFTNDAGDVVVSLEGFITQRDPAAPEAGGRIMVLLMRTDHSVGLLYAVLDKNLSRQ